MHFFSNWNYMLILVTMFYSMHTSLSFYHCVFQHELPSLKGSEEDCIADFVLRKDARISYPGACSLEFQSVMQILMECLLRWDTKTQTAKGKGILGTVVAFAGAYALHRHWQIWVKEINQTVRDSLFHKDTKTRDKNRRT